MENTVNNGLIYGKISQIMRDCPAIGKNQRNAQQGYAYRGIDDAMNTLQNLLPKYGVFYVPEVMESHREERTTAKGGNLIYSVLKVKYTFYAEDGSHISAVVQSEGMDSADKSSNKAMSAACKYALFQVFNIPTVEFVDPDATTPEPSATKAKPATQTQMKTMKYPGDDIYLRAFELPKDFSTVMTLGDAMVMTDRNGDPYGEKTVEQLYYTLGALQLRLERNHLETAEREQLQDKVDAIYLILNQAKKKGGF